MQKYHTSTLEFRLYHDVLVQAIYDYYASDANESVVGNSPERILAMSRYKFNNVQVAMKNISFYASWCQSAFTMATSLLGYLSGKYGTLRRFERVHHDNWNARIDFINNWTCVFIHIGQEPNMNCGYPYVLEMLSFLLFKASFQNKSRSERSMTSFHEPLYCEVIDISRGTHVRIQPNVDALYLKYLIYQRKHPEMLIDEITKMLQAGISLPQSVLTNYSLQNPLFKKQKTKEQKTDLKN